MESDATTLLTYTRPHVLVVDEVGYLTYGPDAANVLFHVVNDRHLRKRPMIFTSNKPLSEWGKVLPDEDLAAAILDRVLERGRFVHLDGPSGRKRHLNLERSCLPKWNGSEFPELTAQNFRNPQGAELQLSLYFPDSAEGMMPYIRSRYECETIDCSPEIGESARPREVDGTV